MAPPADKSPLWDRICKLHSAARKLPPDKQREFLTKECGGDTALEREVAQLLDITVPPTRFLDDSKNPLHARPAHQDRRCKAGDVLSSRFEIVRFLGAGGMGEVYEAFDRELTEKVAIKVLRASGASDEFFNTHFRREIRLARRITHFNICRVYDFAEHEDERGVIVYFVMELLQGETLAQRLQDPEQIPPARALEIARQMAEGLTSAHREGIVHRDFKPGNVMLIDKPEGLRVVVMDFGLAALMSPDTTAALGSLGLLLGTPGYMAPEQAYGGPITPATDVYAFGIVLHEIATRRHPRYGESKPEELTGVWKSVITRCTELEPRARFATSLEAYAELSGLHHPHKYLSRRYFVAAVTTAAAGVALYKAFPRFYEQWVGSLPGGSWAIVAASNNTTNDPGFDGLSVAFRASLAQSAHLNVWNPSRLGDVLRSMRVEPSAQLEVKTWREIALREKVRLVVFSTLSKVGPGYVLSVRTELVGDTPDNPVRSWNRSFNAAGPAGLFESVQEASFWIREVAGEDATNLNVHNRLPQDITSASWEALKLFNDAEKLAAANQNKEAILVLRQAVILDPQFAMALMRLGDLLNTQRRSSEGFQRWREAIAWARWQRLSDHETFNIEGRYALEVGDYTRAEPILWDWARKFPHDPLASQLLASCLVDLGQYNEACNLLRNLELKSGQTFFGASTLLSGLAASNRFAEVERLLPSLDSLAPPSLGLQYRGVSAAMRDDRSSAESYFRKIVHLGTPEAVSRGTLLLAILAADHGEWDDAYALLQEGLGHDKRVGENGRASRKAAGMGFIEYARGNRPGARAWSREAISIEPSARVLTLAGCTLARCEYLGDTRDLLAKFPQDPGARFDAARWRIQGELALAEGNSAGGLALLEKTAKTESALQAKEYLGYALRRDHQEERAKGKLAELASTPYHIWYSPDSEWPGVRFLAQTLK